MEIFFFNKVDFFYIYTMKEKIPNQEVWGSGYSLVHGDSSRGSVQAHITQDRNRLNTRKGIHAAALRSNYH